MLQKYLPSGESTDLGLPINARVEKGGVFIARMQPSLRLSAKNGGHRLVDQRKRAASTEHATEGMHQSQESRSVFWV